MKKIIINCPCGETLFVEDYQDDFYEEESSITKVECSCGERYILRIGLECLGKK